MPLIAIDEEVKARLDKIAAKLAVTQGVKSVTYTTAVEALCELWERTDIPYEAES
jgi:predicted transcriptional regulator